MKFRKDVANIRALGSLRRACFVGLAASETVKHERRPRVLDADAMAHQVRW